MKNRTKIFLVGLTIYLALAVVAIGLSYLLWLLVPFWLLAVSLVVLLTVYVALIYANEPP